MESLSSKKKTGLVVLGLGAAAAAIWYLSSQSEAQAASLPDGNLDPLPPDSPSTTHPIPSVTDYPNVPQTLSPWNDTVRRGDPNVQLYQQRLSQLGYDPGPIDGIFGGFTRRAVMDFQRDNNLTVDGILGPRTKAALDAAAGQAAPISGLVGRKTFFWRV